MKKILAACSALLAASAAAADVRAGNVQDGTAELIFSYENPEAEKVSLVGDFNGWNMEADAMENDGGTWTLSLRIPAGSSVTYKFVADGNWISDPNAPDSDDDGFGGKNGVVTVTADGKIGKPIPKAKPREQHVEFHTWTNIGFQNCWTTAKNGGEEYSGDFSEDSAGLGFKSYWKFTGNATPSVPIFLELATAENESFSNIYEKGSLSWGDGFRDFALGLFSPISYANDGTSADLDDDDGDLSYLGHLKFGISSPYVKYTMGWKYAGLPGHTSANWTTVDPEWEAGYEAKGGFGHLETGEKLSSLLSDATGGALKVNAAISLNRSADRKGRRFGLYSWISADILRKHYIDFQYNGAYGDTNERAFDDIVEADLIAGYKGAFGPLTVKANALANFYGNSKSTGENGKVVRYDPDSPDVGGVEWNPDNKLDNIAANANASFDWAPFRIVMGGRFRGYQAHMLYVKEGYQEEEQENQLSRQLGPVNTQRYFADIGCSVSDALSLGIAPYMQMNLTKDEGHSFYKDTGNIEFVVRPRFFYDLSKTLGRKSSVDGYIEGSFVSADDDKYARGNESRSAIISEAGLRFIPRSDITLLYGFNGNPTHGVYYDAKVQNYALHFLLASLDVPLGITVMAGAGIRQAYSGVGDFSETGISPWGFAFGARKVIDRTWNVTLHGEFSYNFDPFAGFGSMSGKFFLRDYVLDRDNDWAANLAKLRIGVNIDF